MEPDSWIALLAALLCLALIALDSAVETALTNISRLRLRQLLEKGVPRAQAINDLLDNPQRFPTTLLFVNTIALLTTRLACAVCISAFYRVVGACAGCSGRGCAGAGVRHSRAQSARHPQP